MACILSLPPPDFVSQRIWLQYRDIRLQNGPLQTCRAYIMVFKWLRRPQERAQDVNQPTRKTIMKTWIKTSIVAALIGSSALGTAVMARGGDCDGGMGGKASWHTMAPAQMQERMTQRSQEHLARLELALALTPEQRPAWEGFKASMKERSERMVTHMQARGQADQPKTVLERMARMEEMSKLRQAEMAETRKAVEALYPQLSDAQKIVFDAEFMEMHGRGDKGERGMRHGGKGDGAGMGPGRG